MSFARSITIRLAAPVAAVLAAACGGGSMGNLPSASAKASAKVTVNAGGDGETQTLGSARFADDVCQGVDITPETRRLTIHDVQDLLRKQGLPFKISQERDDLHLFDVSIHDTTVRLRVATLGSAREAGRHLHVALLEHGDGYWGVHRSNIAILGAPGSLDEALGFSKESGLACWGVFTTVGRDDTFVVPGGYFEF